MTETTYSTSKIEQRLNFHFTDIDKTIKKYANWFIASQD